MGADETLNRNDVDVAEWSGSRDRGTAGVRVGVPVSCRSVTSIPPTASRKTAAPT